MKNTLRFLVLGAAAFAPLTAWSASTVKLNPNALYQAGTTPATLPTQTQVDQVQTTAAGAVQAAGGNASNTKVTPLGTGTLARTQAAIAADSINLLNYAVDPTGTNNSEPGIAQAISDACASTPVKAISVPYGGANFAFATPWIGTGCDGLRFTGLLFRFGPMPGEVPGTLPDGNGAGFTLNFTGGADNISFDGLQVDGSNNTNSTVTNALMTFKAPMANLTINGHKIGGFQNNPYGTAIWLFSQPTISLNTAAATTGGVDTVLTFTNPPASLHAGAFITLGDGPLLYITELDTSGTTVSAQLSGVTKVTHPLGDNLHFSQAFGLTAAVAKGQTTLQVDDVRYIGVRYSVYEPGTRCLPLGDRIKSITPAGSGNGGTVVLEQGASCPIAAGINIAAAAGFPGFAFLGNRVSEIGMGMALTGSASYVTTTDTPPGTAYMTFACVSGVSCGEVGLVQGNQTAGTGLPAGVPASDPIIGRTVNQAAGTYTVQLQNAVTQDVPAGTTVPWAVQHGGGNGYGIWHANGAWFADVNWDIEDNYFKHTYAAALYLNSIGYATLLNNTIEEDWLNYQSPTVAPSPCYNLSDTVGVTLGDRCSGATGTGYETAQMYYFRVLGGAKANNNGVAGLQIAGGAYISIADGATFMDNNQAALWQMAQGPQNNNGHGVMLNACAAYSQACAAMTNVVIGNIIAGDDQLTPTQQYGVGKGGKPGYAGSPVSVVFGALSGSGNVLGLADPSLGPQPLYSGQASPFSNQQEMPATLIGVPTITNPGTASAIGNLLTINAGCTGTVANDVGGSLVQHNPVLQVTGITDGGSGTGPITSWSISDPGVCLRVPPSPYSMLFSTGSDATATATGVNNGWGGSWTPTSSAPVMVTGCGSGGGAGGAPGVAGTAPSPGTAGQISTGVVKVTAGTSYAYYIGQPGLGGAAGQNNGTLPFNGRTQFGNTLWYVNGGAPGQSISSGVRAAASQSYPNIPSYAGLAIPSGYSFLLSSNLPGIANTGAAGVSTPFGAGGAAGANANGGNAIGPCAGGGAPAATGTTPLSGGNGGSGMLILAQ